MTSATMMSSHGVQILYFNVLHLTKDSLRWCHNDGGLVVNPKSDWKSWPNGASEPGDPQSISSSSGGHYQLCFSGRVCWSLLFPWDPVDGRATQEEHSSSNRVMVNRRISMASVKEHFDIQLSQCNQHFGGGSNQVTKDSLCSTPCLWTGWLLELCTHDGGICNVWPGTHHKVE